MKVSVETKGNDVEITVRDNGCGIPGEALPRIWERLYRVDPSRTERGRGLGLSLVKAIATAHQGRVSVESAPGDGSTFVLSLPLHSTEPPGSRRPAGLSR